MTVLAVSSCFVFDGVARNRVFWRYFVTVDRNRKNPVSSIVREYRRVRRYRISLSAIELLTATHPTK
ncbi:MAG: hypothetical protein P2A85_08475 [Microcoleus anatoxicus]|uniref:hypothetical protein n=1 Tax=Microcoleus anatoxicus TaxID=2705319 RepID=UPI00366CE4B7